MVSKYVKYCVGEKTYSGARTRLTVKTASCFARPPYINSSSRAWGSRPKLTFLLFQIFLFLILCFDSLGFLEVGRVLAPAFSLFVRVGELFLTGNSFVRGTDWEVMNGTFQ